MSGGDTVRPFRRSGPAPTPDRAVRQESLRSHNLALVFRRVVAAGSLPISRAELAASTGLTRATVSRLVEQLLAGRLLTEVDRAQRAPTGRPPVGLTLSRRGPAGLGLDVKGDYLVACVVDLTGAVRHLAFRPGPWAGRAPREVVAELATMAGAAGQAAAAEGLTVMGSTVAVPGPVDDRRVVRMAVHLGWRDVDLVELFARAHPRGALPVAVDNEANLGALGEMHSANGGLSDFLYVSGEFGIGAGIVLDGRVMRGARGWSGELGHMTVYPDGLPCPCGARGCLECYAGLSAILGAVGVGTDPAGSASAATIAAAADAGSPAVRQALDAAGTALGIAVGSLVNVLDVETVLLGGSYAVLASWLLEPLQAQLRVRVVSNGWSPVQVRPSLLGPEAPAIGAALTAVAEVRHDPHRWLAGLI